MSNSFKALFRATGFAVLAVVLASAMVLGLAACNGDDDNDVSTTVSTAGVTGGDAASSVVGKWYCEKIDETLEFTSGGKVLLTSKGEELADVLTYTVSGGQIIVRIMATDEPRTIEYTLDGNTLTTVDPKYGTLTYTKS